MFRTEVVEKIKIYIFIFNFFCQKSYVLWDNVEKYGTARWDTWQYDTKHTLCMLDKNATDTHSERVVLLSHGINAYTNAPDFYVYAYIACLCIM
jgi:hypothetical protein